MSTTSLTHGNTSAEMVTSGAWVKVGRKHYQHVTGLEIKYNHNAWAWETIGTVRPGSYKALWAARWHVEREASLS